MIFRRLARRTLLRGVGVSLALPRLECMRPAMAREASAESAPRRLVAINLPLGFIPENFFPVDAGPTYRPSPYLQLATKIRDRYTVISGTSHPGVDGGHAAEKSFLTCAPHPGERGFQNSISLDQVIAKQIGDRTRFASMTLGETSLSWSANGVMIPQQNRPAQVFGDLFFDGSKREIRQVRQQIQDGQSILDSVLQDARAMQRRISLVDQQKLDQYLTAVREAENRLSKAETWTRTPKPVVDVPPPEQDFASGDVVGRLRGMLDVVRLAIQTDSCRVFTYGSSGGGLVVPLPGVEEGYHGLSHHGRDESKLGQLEIVDRALIGVWVDFIDSLREIDEDDETLLDRTQVLFGSNLGNASAHQTNNLPILLAGGRYRHGQHLALGKSPSEDYPLPNLFVNLLQEIGIETDAFATSTGTVTGLT